MGKPKNPFHLLLKGTVQVTDCLSRCIPCLVNDFHRGLGGGERLKNGPLPYFDINGPSRIFHFLIFL